MLSWMTAAWMTVVVVDQHLTVDGTRRVKLNHSITTLLSCKQDVRIGGKLKAEIKVSVYN